MSTITTDLYRSSNGDRWLLLHDDATGREIVRHEANLASGGQATETSIDEFLARSGTNPEREALLAVLARRDNWQRDGSASREQDLVALWEAHTRYEFETRDVNATMATMVAEPYVNHIPTMTGGVGHAELKRFYKYHFIGVNPPDFRLTLISRTVGTDRIVDEFVVHFTHTTEIDWMLPGISPTGREVSIPTVAIVQFEGDKLVHEHIYWDQASVLVQIGKLDPSALPVAGAETARKAIDKTAPSNVLMGDAWLSSAGKPA